MTAWTNSVALEKLHRQQAANQPLRLAFSDIDDTWTGHPPDQVALRKALEEHQYVTICVTNRDLQLTLSKSAAEQSPPNIAQRNFGDTDRSTIAGFAGILDLDIIACSLGEEIAIKQSNGTYQLDKDHEQNIHTN